MRGYSFQVTEDAERDLEEIEAYVATYREADFVDALSDEFDEAFRKLCENPFAHPVYQFEEGFTPTHEYRSVNVYNFKVFYRVDELARCILIYRIRHQVSDFTRVRF